jgi:N-acyl-D-amino-acid deacylase
MMGIGTALNPFTVRPTYKQLESLPIDGQRMRLRDPNVRRQILAEQPSDAEVAKLAKFRQDVISSWDRFFVMEDPPDYEPPPEKSIAAMAARCGRPPDEVAYDYITEADGRYLYFPLVNYVTRDHAPIREMMNDPACLLGLSDGGAHCTSIVDSGLAATGGADQVCRWNFWSSARPARPRISSIWPIVAVSRLACAPTST